MNNLEFLRTNTIISRKYKDDKNIKIEYNNSNNNLAYVYFSSNGLYFPNTENIVKNIFEYEDRYEWTNLASSIPSVNVFVRDVRKSWYMEGINKDLNSVEKIVNELKTILQNKQIITIGSSAGGYAAILFGDLLNAEHIIAFAPQISISLFLENTQQDCNPIYFEHINNKTINKYFNISNIISDSEIPTVVFYPKYSQLDVLQIELIKKDKNIIIIPLNDNSHGVGIYSFVIKGIINKELEFFREISNKYIDNSISKVMLSIKTIGFMRTIFNIAMKPIKKRK